MSNPTLLGSYAFNALDTSPGAAGSTTGLAPTGVVDYLGGVWKIQNAVAVAPGNTGAYCSNFALAPIATQVANPRVQAQFQHGGGTPVLAARFDLSSQHGYAVRYDGGYLRIFYLLGNNGFQDAALSSAVVPLVNGTTYYLRFDVQSTDSTHSNLTATLFSDAAYSVVVATASLAGDNGGTQVAGGQGIGAWNTGAANTWAALSVSDLGPPAPIVGGCTAFPVSGSTAQIALSAPAPTGGSGTYTDYQWFYSLTDPTVTSATGTPLAGATGLSATHVGLAPGQSVYYVLRVTDANGATSDSYVTMGTTFRARFVVGTLLDSLTAGNTAANDTAPNEGDVIQQYLRAAKGPNEVTLVNGAIAGMQLNQYLPGQSNNHYAAFLAAMQAAVQAQGALGIVSFCGGTNDCAGGTNPTTTVANAALLLNDLVASGFKVVLHDIPLTLSPASNSRAIIVNALLGSFADGVNVFRDVSLYALSNANTVLFEDGFLHPNATGRALWGICRGQAVYNALTAHPATDPTLCKVYAYVETPQGAPSVGAKLLFTLKTPSAIRGTRLIAGRSVQIATDSAGYCEILLERPDKLTPSGSTWIVQSYDLGINPPGIPFLPNAETFDLMGIV